jgi:membrane-bound lytic murein transglycosylase D
MRHTVLTLLLCVPVLFFLLTGCAATATTSRSSSPDASRVQTSRDNGEDGQFSERQKWSLAREAFAQATAEEKKKNNEAAAYYYEVALELLGSLDMAAIEVPTRRVLDFQRKVLQNYDHFLASIDNLPSTAGPIAILESSQPSSDSPDDIDLPETSAADRDTKPIAIVPNAPRLPDVPACLNGDVAGQINFFMNKGRKVMLKWMERAAYMFPRMRPILQQEGIPEDVLFLSMIESGLNLKAYSYAHAAGLWQFIPGTGKIYGLERDRTYDERFHVEEATRAACRYLRKLHDEFGDWFLAFAAYNCGEMRIERELNRMGRNRDYWSLRHRLPRQTRGYVPAYLAARAIYKNPTQYGFPPVPQEVPFECERIELNGSYRLDDLAISAGADPVLVAEMNPEFTRGVTRSGAPCTVRMPRNSQKALSTKLATLPKMVMPQIAEHRVKSGETLASIAKRYGTTVEELKTIPENRRFKSGRLKSGSMVLIPVSPKEDSKQVAQTPPVRDKAAEAKAENAAAPVAERTESEIIYTVHKGETLGRISQQLGVPVAEICRQNKISDPDLVQPGRKLSIRVPRSAPDVAQTPVDSAAASRTPQASASTAAQSPIKNTAAPQTHTVQPGDTVWSIARTYGLDPHRLMNLNNLSRNGRIYPGQELIINQ